MRIKPCIFILKTKKSNCIIMVKRTINLNQMRLRGRFFCIYSLKIHQLSFTCNYLKYYTEKNVLFMQRICDT